MAHLRIAVLFLLLHVNSGLQSQADQSEHVQEHAEHMHVPSSEMQDHVYRGTGEQAAQAALAGGTAARSTDSWDQLWAQVEALKPASDKFAETHQKRGHHYQAMYKPLLLPWHLSGVAPKFFEIGLGCNMDYGPGASVAVWRTLFPGIDLWEAEYNEDCVKKSVKDGTLPKGVSVVTGDQGDPEVVTRWAKESGGDFDVVVDDGGHQNGQIKTSFDALWPHVKKGGVYFIEDLQIGRESPYDDTNGQAVMSDIIQSWVEQLLIAHPQELQKWPVPADVELIVCQSEACAIVKRK